MFVPQRNRNRQPKPNTKIIGNMSSVIFQKIALPFGVGIASMTSLGILGFIIDDAYKYNVKLIKQDYENQINNLKQENRELHEKLRPFIVTTLTKL